MVFTRSVELDFAKTALELKQNFQRIQEHCECIKKLTNLRN